MKKLIELKGVSRTYGNGNQTRTVLKNVDLTIVAGEMVAIIGASGSGKSTLMNIMGCLDVPNRGDYYIDGQNAACLSPDELARVRREHIGFIFQRYHLIPDLSALGNVEIPAIYVTAVDNVQPRCWADWDWKDVSIINPANFQAVSSNASVLPEH